MTKQFQLVISEEKSTKLTRVFVKAKTAWHALLAFVRKSVKWIEKADKLIVHVTSQLISHGVFKVHGDRRRVNLKKVEEKSTSMSIDEEKEADLPQAPPLKRRLTTTPKKAKKAKKAKKI